LSAYDTPYTSLLYFEKCPKKRLKTFIFSRSTRCISIPKDTKSMLSSETPDI